MASLLTAIIVSVSPVIVALLACVIWWDKISQLYHSLAVPKVETKSNKNAENNPLRPMDATRLQGSRRVFWRNKPDNPLSVSYA